MKDWNTKASAFERGARSGPVGTPSCRIDCPYSRFSTAWAGNSVGAKVAELATVPPWPKVMKWSRNAITLPDASRPPFRKWNPAGR